MRTFRELIVAGQPEAMTEISRFSMQDDAVAYRPQQTVEFLCDHVPHFN